MQCLIIAAGQGRRLRQQGDGKPLVPLLGVPLIERVIRAAREAGADAFYVVIAIVSDIAAATVLKATEATRLPLSTARDS